MTRPNSPWVYTGCPTCGTKEMVRVLNGDWVRQRREEQGKTLREFAKRVAISPAYLSDIERGNRMLRPTNETAYDIIYELGGNPATPRRGAGQRS